MFGAPITLDLMQTVGVSEIISPHDTTGVAMALWASSLPFDQNRSPVFNDHPRTQRTLSVRGNLSTSTCAGLSNIYSNRGSD